MKKLACILLVFSMILTFNIKTKASEIVFSDISHSYAKTYIETLAKEQIVSGVNGQFYPKNNITRAQFAKILSLSMDLELDSSYASSFKDVPLWAKPYVGALAKNGITTGKTPTIFGSNDYLTREQMAVFFVRATGLESLVEGLEFEPNFKDYHRISSHAQPHVAFAKEIGLITGSNYQFLPKNLATREQVAKLAYLFSFEGHQYFENSLNIVIPSYIDKEIDYVHLSGDEEVVNIRFTDGESEVHELVILLPFLELSSTYYSFQEWNGFDWAILSLQEKNELLQLFLDFWKHPYSGYDVLKADSVVKKQLLTRLNSYFINNENNRDELFRNIVWAAVDEGFILYND